MTAQTTPTTNERYTVLQYAKLHGMYMNQQTLEDIELRARTVSGRRNEAPGTHAGLFGEEPTFTRAALREVFSTFFVM